MKKHALTLCSLLLSFGSTYANNDEKLAELNNKLNANTISFQENKGQVYDQNYHSRPDVLFSGQNQGLVYHLKNNGISYQLSRIDSYKEVEDELTKEKRKEIDQSTIYRIDVNWLNANIAAPIIKGEALQGYNNYYLASCPDGALNVKSYQNITYQNIYDGIDLKWYSKAGELKYDYLVAPGADYTNIKLEIKGAERIFINKKGELEIKTPLGTLIEKAPYVEQEGKELHSAWKIQNNNTIGFEIENSNPNLPLLIDPAVRIWGTYYGGTNDEQGRSCAVDTSGKVYLAGYTNSNTGTSIATVGSHQNTYGGGTDAFLVQFNSSGVRLWATYYGGTDSDYGNSCVVDASGKVYLVGLTFSMTGIATAGSHQSILGGGTFDNDAFLVQFDAAGVRQWATYYGGTDYDDGYSCAVDDFGKVYLAGYTKSTTGISTVGSHQSVLGGVYDAFLVQFNSSGVRLWATYYGGTGDDYGYSCAVDASGKVYLVGPTKSTTGIATVGSHQPAFGGGWDVFLVQFNSSGVRLWGTYYGGTANDVGSSCVVDASGKVYLAGSTSTTTGIATVGSHQPAFGGGPDAFLVQFNSSGVRQWATYYGGTGDDVGSSCVVDDFGKVYLSGYTKSTTGISTVGSHQSVLGGVNDAFLVQFNSSGVRQWGTYYGGTGDDYGYSCAVDASGKVYLAGRTSSTTGIATVGSHQSIKGGGTFDKDAFLVQFGCVAATSIDVQTSCNSITWLDGNTYTSSTNTPIFTFAGGADNGCDSVITLNFTHNPVTNTDIQTSCNSITWIDGNTYTSSTNTPTFTIAGGAANGCDSVVMLNFSHNPVTSTDIQTSCNSFTWIDGITYTSSTNMPTFTIAGGAANGCDSVVMLNFTHNPVTSTDIQASCNSFTWIDGNTYTSSTNTPTFTIAGGAANGCDSVVTLNLTILYPATGIDVQTSCNSITWIDGYTYSVSTNMPTFTIVGGAANGCDSVVTLNYTFNPATSTHVQTACNSFTWIDGYTYTSSINTIDSLVATNGCDSVVILNLTIINIDTSITQNINTLSAGETGATYQWLDCNNGNAIITGEINQSYIPASSGNYAVVVSKNGCTDTSACINFIITGISDLENPFVKISPNPTTAEFIIELTNFSPKTQLSIVSVEGKTVYTNNTITANKIVINAADWSKGIYMVKITDKQSSQVVKLIKQ